MNPGHCLGIDGSENLRAWYYWRFLQRNYEYLSDYFEFFGLKYYVRVTRFGKHQYDDPFDFGDIQTKSQFIFKTNDRPEQMYNYFVFRLKSNKSLLNNLK